jgi:hypothetical protein
MAAIIDYALTYFEISDLSESIRSEHLAAIARVEADFVTDCELARDRFEDSGDVDAFVARKAAACRAMDAGMARANYCTRSLAGTLADVELFGAPVDDRWAGSLDVGA